MGTGPAVEVGFKPYVPTKKWFAALITGAAAVAAHAVLSGGWDETENGEIGTVLLALAGAYIKRNDPTPGGYVPE
jgi:hypothetical protein